MKRFHPRQVNIGVRAVRCPTADSAGHRCIKIKDHDGPHRAFGKEWTDAQDVQH